jgi:hypothetical protein
MTTMARSTSEIKKSSTPTIEATASGLEEKAIMPSSEYKNSFQKDHLVSPAFRPIFSYSNHFVLNPIQGKSLLENLVRS